MNNKILITIILTFISVILIVSFFSIKNYDNNNNHHVNPPSPPHPQIRYKETPFKYLPNRELKDEKDVPSYQDISKGPAGIWNCGDDNYDEDTAMCYKKNGVKPNHGLDEDYGVCHNIIPWYSKCCMSVEGCRPKGLFNWIIGTCNNRKAGCSISPYKSQMIINYVGSYQWDTNKNMFICQQESSFNMDGQHKPYDTSKVYGGLGKGNNWLPGPLPGGAANWDEGFYPAGRKGVGAPAMLFIVSVNKMSNSCWYVLNQSDLDRGPAVPMSKDLCKSKRTGNTWACNNSGEFDFIEAPCAGNDPKFDFTKGYSTGMSPYNLGQYGRCMFWSKGSYGGYTGGGGWLGSSKYFTLDKDTDPETPRIFVGIVDQMGMRTYQIPSKNSEKYWPGIRIDSADMELGINKLKPKISPCVDKTTFCATFNPFCPKEAGGPENYEKWKCMMDGTVDRGFCGNWVHDKLIFLGPESLWGTDGKTPTLDGVKIGSWNADMESPPENI